MGGEMNPALRIKFVVLASALACTIAFVASPTVRHTANILAKVAWLYAVTGSNG
jgi:hypothetical protein